MPTPTKGARMGGSPAHQKHMLANLAASLFEHGKITTTEARARRLRPYAEKLITFAKRGDMHDRRPGQARAPRRLHPDHKERYPQGRRRPDGGHRAGQGRGRLQPPAPPDPPFG